MPEENKTSVTPEGQTITFCEQESVGINLNISKDTFDTLKEIAGKRELSVESLLKFFIGKGLRELEPELMNKLAIKRFKSRRVVEDNQKVDLAA